MQCTNSHVSIKVRLEMSRYWDNSALPAPELAVKTVYNQQYGEET